MTYFSINITRPDGQLAEAVACGNGRIALLVCVTLFTNNFGEIVLCEREVKSQKIVRELGRWTPEAPKGVTMQ